jgi:hypothetical protein
LVGVMQVSAKIYIDIDSPEVANFNDRYHPRNMHIPNIYTFPMHIPEVVCLITS